MPPMYGMKPADEHEHGQWPGVRHPDQGQDDEAQRRVNGRDHRGSANVSAGSVHGLLGGVADPVALPAAEALQSDVPGLVPVEEQIEGQEEAEHDDGPGLDQGIDDRRGLLG